MERNSARIGPVVRIHGLRKQYGEGPGAVHALNGVDLEIGCGQFLSVMGPSGCGKSTLLHLIAALDAPSDGSIHIGEVRVDALGQDEAARFRRRRLGIIFQFFNLIPSLSVEENVALPFLLDGRALADVAPRVEELLAGLGIGALRAKAPATLSGGEMQRVAIARALVGEPMLVLADEPTGNLDSRAGEEVLGALRRACDDRGVTLLLVTHDLRSASYADRVVIMRDGKVESDLPNLHRGR